MPQFAATEKVGAIPAGASSRATLLAAAARGLTVFRLLAIVPLVSLLLRIDSESGLAPRLALVGLYAAAALSDFFDGRLARKAGTASVRWAKLDAGVDMLFNFAGFVAAAALGLIGFSVPAVLAVLGGRFLWRISRREPDPRGRLDEDRLGKLAGVLYYALVGWIVAEVASGGILGRAALARGGDAVFVYSLVALWRGREPMSSRRL